MAGQVTTMATVGFGVSLLMVLWLGALLWARDQEIERLCAHLEGIREERDDLAHELAATKESLASVVTTPHSTPYRMPAVTAATTPEEIRFEEELRRTLREQFAHLAGRRNTAALRAEVHDGIARRLRDLRQRGILRPVVTTDPNDPSRVIARLEIAPRECPHCGGSLEREEREERSA